MISSWEKIIQMGFVAHDIHATMSELTEKLNVGPWFLRERGTFKRQLYCGEPTQMSLAVAMGYVAGAEMQYEIIQQLDDLPSIYGEVRKSALGVGFHHFGIATSDFDRSVKSYRDRGFKAVYEADVPGGVRVCFFDTRTSLPGMVEFIEFSPDLNDMFESYRAASVGWQGDNPVRARPPLPASE